MNIKRYSLSYIFQSLASTTCLRIFVIVVIYFIGMSVSVPNKAVSISNALPARSVDSGTINGIKYIYIESDTFYSFKGSFHTSVEYQCLMDISYQMKHKKKYNTEVSDMKMITEGKNWYTSMYYFKRYVLLENQSEWLTVRDISRNRVDFKMLKSKSNLDVANIIVSSFGHYQFLPDKTGCRVEYYQEGHTIKGSASKIYLGDAKKEMLKYINSYKVYLSEACKRDTR
jgi:hypothetical protein